MLVVHDEQAIGPEEQVQLDYKLYKTIKKKKGEKAQRLLAQGAHAVSPWLTWPCLHLAARYGCKKIIPALVEKDRSQLEAKTEFGHLPLQLAASHFHVGAVKALLAQGADVRAADCTGTALHAVVQQYTDASKTGKQVKIIMMLLAAGVDRGAVNKKGQTPLSMVTSRPHVSELVVQALSATQVTNFNETE